MKQNTKLLLAFFLNFSFSILELVGGLLSGSIAILSDAVHDLGDAFSIGTSLALEGISRRKPNKTYTYGYYRYSVLGSVLQASVLLVGSFLILYHAVLRLQSPVPIDYNGMLLIAVIGFTVNFAAAYFTRGGGSLNQKAINLHMLEDVLGWAIVLLGALCMRFTDWYFLDPLLSIVLSVFVGYHAVKHLGTVLDIFLEKVPKGIDLEELRQHLMGVEGVIEIHHLHVWSRDGYRSSATLHVVTEADTAEVKRHIREELAEHGIDHATIECEKANEHCSCPECSAPERSSLGMHHHHHH